MKFLQPILASAILSLSPVCHAEPDPAPDAAVITATAPVPRIKVGGPCLYDVTEINAAVSEVNDTGAVLNLVEGRTISFDASQFMRTGGEPEVGQSYKVAKNSIKQGTCVPVTYELIGPADAAAPEEAP